MNKGRTGLLDTAPEASPPTERAAVGIGRVLGIERRLAARLLESFDGHPIHIVLWDGEEFFKSQHPPVARLIFRDRAALFKLILNPELQFGELYTAGRIDVEGDLVALVEATYRSAANSEFYNGHSKVRGILRQSNTLRDSRQNIHHHYDIGNDFYRLWLDEQMVYTCAYFPDPAMSLEAAQIAKLDHVCRKLRLQPGERVIEAGCGWGSLALHMARHYGVKVRAFNISHQQILYARERAKIEELSNAVEFVEDDYRNITCKCDVFASVGMLEHVGLQHYRELSNVVNRCLSDSGRGLIHSIGRNKPLALNTWIAKRIFPGAYVPALSEMMDVFEPWSLSVLDVENLRLHYAVTLKHWLQRFEAAREQIADMFDEQFVRAWRLYLAGSLAAFTTGWMQLFQIVFSRATKNDIPWNRAHVYTHL